MTDPTLLRKEIRKEVSGIVPLDEIERADIRRALDWIDSGAPLARTEKPATPNPHLVSYFVVMDGDHILLVDHINAELWLPTGGHVDPDEHPQTTVTREAQEELALEAEFVFDTPLFITVTDTVGKTAGHTDISLWYVLRGDRTKDYDFDQTEFETVRWFHRDHAPTTRTEPNLTRFMAKLATAAQ